MVKVVVLLLVQFLAFMVSDHGSVERLKRLFYSIILVFLYFFFIFVMIIK